jgi:hypothetical protein
MLIAGVLCLCAGALSAVAALRSVRRPHSADPGPQALRALAPTQLAAAVMLVAGGAVALAGDARAGPFLMVACVLGAVGTVTVGSWQGARYAFQQTTAGSPSGEWPGNCAGCTLTCGDKHN